MAKLGLLLAMLLALGSATGRAAGALPTQCEAVPEVPGVNQDPSDPADYGKCTASVESNVAGGSNWCTFNSLGYWPAGPSKLAKQCMKFGRMTVYRGPIYGSEPSHKGACNADLAGSNETAVVAVSTKHLKTSQSGWSDDKGSCGQCMCVHMRGVDDKYNPGVNYYQAKNYFGLTFLAKVADRCGECEDDHIDVLLDRPLAYAPYDPASPKENQNARYVNSLPGLRGFGNAHAMRGGATFSPEAVGTWVADWQWVPCEGFSHAACGELMTKMGYTNVWEPMATPAVDAVSMTYAAEPTVPFPWSSDKPKAVYPTPKVGALAMCGGKGSGCTAVQATHQCEDQQWADCPSGYRCNRQNMWYWDCQKVEQK